MKFVPHRYQRRAIGWIKEHTHCGLFLDMGLGKSVCTLTAIAELMDSCEVSSVLVVAPLKVAESTWSAEVAKWDHLRHLRVSEVLGTKGQRRRALEAEADIYVTSRDLLVKVLEEYAGKALPWDMLVVDELTSFKHQSSLRFKALRRKRAFFTRIVGLTGTPAPNGLKDLWGQLFVIDGGARLERYEGRFLDRWFDAVVHNHVRIRVFPKKGAEEEIRSRISDICLSMRAEDWLELPEIVEMDDRVQLPKAAMKFYTDFAREQVAALDGQTITAANAAGLLNKLGQVANGALYTGEKDTGCAPQYIAVHSAKTARLSEILEAEGDSVLVFYRFRHDLERIKAALPPNMRVVEYTGPADLEAWNAGEIDVLLAHPASTAYGLNMQAGGRCIVWFGTGWDCELYQQANARLYRQGQTRPVRVHRIIAAGTVDERAAAAITQKSRTQQALMSALREVMAGAAPQ